MKRDNGFTLVELMVTMTVVVVLLAAGIPSFKAFVSNNRVSGEASKMIIAMQVTRSEALKRGSGAVICASADQLTCSGSNNWATGWITFSDLDQDGVLDGNGICTTAAENLTRECIMRKNTALGAVTVTATDSLDPTQTVINLQFLPNGRIGIGMTTSGTVIFKVKANNCENKQQRAVAVTRLGHVSSTEQNCS